MVDSLAKAKNVYGLNWMEGMDGKLPSGSGSGTRRVQSSNKGLGACTHLLDKLFRPACTSHVREAAMFKHR